MGIAGGPHTSASGASICATLTGGMKRRRPRVGRILAAAAKTTQQTRKTRHTRAEAPR